jgi:hypothetical protein
MDILVRFLSVLSHFVYDVGGDGFVLRSPRPLTDRVLSLF